MDERTVLTVVFSPFFLQSLKIEVQIQHYTNYYCRYFSRRRVVGTSLPVVDFPDFNRKRRSNERLPQIPTWIDYKGPVVRCMPQRRLRFRHSFRSTKCATCGDQRADTRLFRSSVRRQLSGLQEQVCKGRLHHPPFPVNRTCFSRVR